MVVAFIPFPTQLVADYIRDGGNDARDAVLAYGITLTLMAVAYNVMWFYAIRRGRLLRGGRRSERPSPASPAASAPACRSTRCPRCSPSSSPAASFALFGALALFYVFEGSIFARNEKSGVAAEVTRVIPSGLPPLSLLPQKFLQIVLEWRTTNSRRISASPSCGERGNQMRSRMAAGANRHVVWRSASVLARARQLTS